MSRRKAHQNRAGVGPALATRESLQTNIAPVLCSRDFTKRTQLFDGHYEEVREGQITPEGSRYQPSRGPSQALDWGYANFAEFPFRDCMKKPQVRANRLSMRRLMAAYTRTPRWLHTASRSPCSSFCCERSREMSVPPPSGVGGPEMLAVAEASANLDYLAFLGQSLRPR